jgi:hypothetical protein
MKHILETFDFYTLLRISKSWSGNSGISQETTKTNLILLILDSMKVDK